MTQNSADTQYLANAQHLVHNARLTGNRTDTSAYKDFGTQMTFDLREGFPLLTTKRVHLKSVIHELLWIIKGETNIEYLTQNGCRIWNEWATESGELGPVYGAQWRYWQDTKFVSDSNTKQKLEQLGYISKGNIEGSDECVMTRTVDQLDELVNTLKNDPLDRRMIVTAYNPGVKPTTTLKPHENAEIGLQALPPCHMMFHVNAHPLTQQERIDYVIEQGIEQKMNVENSEPSVDGVPVNDAVFRHYIKVEIEDEFNEKLSNRNYNIDEVLDMDYQVPKYFLDMQMYQRSADWFLGVPFNIASYALLLMMLAQQTDMIPRKFIHTFGDFHIYENHIDVINTQLQQPHYNLPKMTIKKADSIDSYVYEDFVLSDYECGPTLKGKVAV